MPEIMAGALQESKRGVHGDRRSGKQQTSNWAALPEHAEVERREPERGQQALHPLRAGLKALQALDGQQVAQAHRCLRSGTGAAQPAD